MGAYKVNHLVNFKEGLSGKPQLLTYDQLKKINLNNNKDYYISIFKYSDKHKEQVEKTGSVAKISDVTTDTLVWDFDDVNNVEQARKDTVTLCTRLVKEYNVDADDISCYMSGLKGFHVFLLLNKEITPEQFKQATTKLASDLITFDTSVSDAARLIRLEHTKHPKSGLYKIPLHISEIDEMTVDQIKEMAKTSREDYEQSINPVSLPESFFTILKKEKKVNTDTKDLDFKKKPKGMVDYVYAILEGHYDSGSRHQALMVLAAKCRSLGFDKEATFYLCKSSIKKQAKRTGQDEFDKSELWENIIEKSIFSDNWEGGSYSPKNNVWLAKYCDGLGIKWSNITEGNVTNINEAYDMFSNYAINIDKLTIKTGIKELDEKLRLTVGMSVGLVAPPGAGKTSVGLQIVKNMSKSGHRCVFFSYDMYAPIVYQKLVQNSFGIDSNEMFRRFKDEPKFRDDVKSRIEKDYSKVSFCFKQGQTVKDILETIEEVEENTGEKVKFVLMDYNELVITDVADPTQSSNLVAQKMREYSHALDICVLSLFQPTKHSGDPYNEIVSYTAAKGGGGIAQSVSVMLGMSRPGYNFRNPETDKFMTISCLKNRSGSQFSLDFGWEGITGAIASLSEDARQELKEIRERRENTNDDNDEWR